MNKAAILVASILSLSGLGTAHAEELEKIVMLQTGESLEATVTAGPASLSQSVEIVVEVEVTTGRGGVQKVEVARSVFVEDPNETHGFIVNWRDIVAVGVPNVLSNWVTGTVRTRMSDDVLDTVPTIVRFVAPSFEDVSVSARAGI